MYMLGDVSQVDRYSRDTKLKLCTTCVLLCIQSALLNNQEFIVAMPINKTPWLSFAITV